MTESDNASFTYLPVPELLSRLGVYVTGAGTSSVPPGSSYPRQRHPELYDFTWGTGRILPEYQFVFIAEGKGEFESRETGIQRVEAGTVMLLFPDVWHRYRPDPDIGWTEYWISIGGDLLFRWHQRGLFSSHEPLMKLGHPAATLTQYRELIALLLDHPEKYSQMQTAHAMAIIVSAIDQHRTGLDASREPFRAEETVDPMVTSALRVIWNHSHQRVSVDMIAKKINANRRTLERRFRNQVGRSLLNELVACRLQRAKRLLRETHVPIKYVAYAAGFSSLSSMCKVFRREMDCTPSDYRDSTFLSEKGNTPSVSPNIGR